MKLENWIITSLTIVGLLSVSRFADAASASYFINSGAGVYEAGKTFSVKVRLNSGGGKGINAAGGKLVFDPKYLAVKKISISTSTQDSIFNYWPESPKFTNKTGIISFAGGFPGSYKGTAGTIFNIEFSALAKGKTAVSFASGSMILSADGTGTNLLKESRIARYILGSSRDVANAKAFTKKMSGRILLEVQKKGEAWYVYPNDLRRYYLGRPDDAFNIMRKLGLGVTHKYLNSYKVFPQNMSGKILLDVEKNGEAYYINPADRKAYYLGRPADAFRVMREKGLGITDANIDTIPDWAI